MTLAMLALLGVLEAVVYLDRYRTAIGASVARSTLSSALTTTTRLLFVWAGAAAVLAGVPWWQALLAYVLPATAANAVAHGFVLSIRTPHTPANRPA